MATKIKLLRMGKIRAPYYRIVVADARTKRDGRVIETIGKYHPKENPSFIEVDADRAAYWLGVGAQPTDPVERILKVTGDWQKFKGEAAPAPMLVKAPAVDRKAAFEAAAREGIEGAKGDATTPKKKAAPKAEKADAPAAEAPAAEAEATEAPAAEAPAAEAAPPAEAAPETAAETPAEAAPEAAPEAAAETPAEPATEAPAETPAETAADKDA